MNIKKIIQVSIIVSFIILLPSSNALTSVEKSQVRLENDGSFIILQEFNEKTILLGRITNLQIVEDIAIFNPISVWYLGSHSLDNETEWFFGHTTNQDKTYGFRDIEFKGILTRGFIFGVLENNFVSTPSILFQKADKAYINSLTVVASDPPDVLWHNIEVQVDGILADHGMVGYVIAGNIIDLTAIAGIGAYTISIRYVPTNTLIGSYDFTAAS